MNTLNENDVERILCRLQLVAEQAPEHLRLKRRQIVRGMRAAIDAMQDDLTTGELYNQLVVELGAPYPDTTKTPNAARASAKPVREQLEAYDDPSPMDKEIIKLWNAGERRAAIAEAVGCSPPTIDRVIRWCSNASVGIQPDAKQRAIVVSRQLPYGH